MAIPAVRENLARISITDPLQVIHSLHLDEAGYRRFCGSGELHTDDNPVLEFSSPLSFHQYNLTFRQNLAETLRYRPADLRPFVTGVPELRAADWDAQAAAAINFCRVLVCFYDVLMAQGEETWIRFCGCLERPSVWLKQGLRPTRQMAFASDFTRHFSIRLSSGCRLRQGRSE
ncbi:MAG UNVERIFIED_CONTAM: hypothetical protein LVR18_05680 [Planctomycetaceae bacterium]|jgi:hypothetical protein